MYIYIYCIYIFIYLVCLSSADLCKKNSDLVPSSLGSTEAARQLPFCRRGSCLVSGRALTPEEGRTVPKLFVINLLAFQPHPLPDLLPGKMVGGV